jgi:two-component system, cell cycle sensor histidine kinase and response regulator CckA
MKKSKSTKCNIKMLIKVWQMFRVVVISFIIFCFFISYISLLLAGTSGSITVLNNTSPSLYVFLITVSALIIIIVFIAYTSSIKSIKIREISRELISAENRNKALLAANTDMLFILDDKYNFIDFKAERIDELYANPADFIGKNIEDILPEYLVKLTIDKIESAKSTGKMQSYEYELEVEGEKLTYDSHVVQFDQDRFLALVRNISERKKREEDSIRSHKLETLGLFAGGIAHDFNNILTTVVGYISLARMKINNKPKVLELLNEAEKESLRARKLTEQLLVFSRGGGPLKEITELNNIVTESAAFVMSGSKTASVYHITEEPLMVNIDSGQIGQVIQNIVLNSLQSMSSGGKIEITLDKRFIGKNNILSLPEGDYAAVEIQDEGTGIEKKNLRRIFDPYFTTKNDSNGLGLTICLNIIKNHGGEIDVKSGTGEGSVFTIFLPISSVEKSEEGDSSNAFNQKSIKNLLIIIMDDEPQLRFIMQEVLEDEGAEIFLASEGNEAIELFEKITSSGKTVDLIIADLTIPGGMGGMEAIRIIREQGLAFKAIVISGYSNDPVISDYKNYGFDAYLVKPFTSHELLAAVKKVC